MTADLVILADSAGNREVPDGIRLARFSDLASWLRRGTIAVNLWAYSDVRLRTYRRDCLFLPFFSSLMIRMLSRRDCAVEDDRGDTSTVTLRRVARAFQVLVRDMFRRRQLIRSVRARSHALAENTNVSKTLDLSAPPLYLRSDLFYGVRAGGSVGHMAGVLNNLDAYTSKPIFLTVAKIPTVRGDLETQIIPPPGAFWDFPSLLPIAFNQTAEAFAEKVIRNRAISFIYQRYSAYNFTGARLAQKRGIPLVLEYNGSESWILKNWSKSGGFPKLLEDIELANLHAADVIVAVSKPLKTELVERGIEGGKILVNPNGVDPKLYSPSVDGEEVRSRYGLQNKTVVGFIGTFARWHGAEVLAEAYGLLLGGRPELADGLGLLMIGDGVTRQLVEKKLAGHGVREMAVLTGLVPQEEGPGHLAACDILIAPHVPNPDGSPFFGSPTKLFEYMAMGKGIVASKLDQIADVLVHDETAWMVEAGDPVSLADGIRQLIENKDIRERLGGAARERVIAAHTWKQHTARIIEKLKERCG